MDLATVIAQSEQGHAPQTRHDFPLGVVTAFDAATVTVLLGTDSVVTVPRLRSYDAPLVNDTVVLARSGQALYCLGALNETAIEPPIEPPEPPPPPPPPPEETTQTLRPTFTGSYVAGAVPFNPNPLFTDDAAYWELSPAGPMTWVEGGVRFSSVPTATRIRNVPYLPNPNVGDPAARFRVRAVVRVEAVGNGHMALGFSTRQLVDGGGNSDSVVRQVNVSAPNTYVLEGIAGAPSTAINLGFDAFVAPRLELGTGMTAWVDSLEIFATPDVPALWRGPASDVPQGKPNPALPDETGAVFYGDGPSTLGGVAVSGAIRVQRLPGGNPAPTAPQFVLLANRDQSDPNGPTVLAGAGTVAGVPLTAGASSTVALPLPWVQQLLDGSAGGIGTDITAAPLTLAGSSSWTPAFELILTYQTGGP